MTRRGLTFALVVAVGLGATGCSKTKKYEAVVQILSKDVVEKSKDGTVTQVDFEVEWDACPGDQFQVLRGGKEFAACTEKYQPGDYVPVIVRHFWDDRGFFRWDVERLGDCWRPVEPDSPGSYEKGQECTDILNHGKKAGFECSRKPFRALMKRCPWMARQ